MSPENWQKLRKIMQITQNYASKLRKIMHKVRINYTKFRIIKHIVYLGIDNVQNTQNDAKLR